LKNSALARRFSAPDSSGQAVPGFRPAWPV
jgi:hypothetical protein